jgi:hypothetical protein
LASTADTKQAWEEEPCLASLPSQKRVGRDKGSPSRCVCLEQADAGFTDDRQRSLSRTHITLTTPASGMSHCDNKHRARTGLNLAQASHPSFGRTAAGLREQGRRFNSARSRLTVRSALLPTWSRPRLLYHLPGEGSPNYPQRVFDLESNMIVVQRWKGSSCLRPRNAPWRPKLRPDLR